MMQLLYFYCIWRSIFSFLINPVGSRAAQPALWFHTDTVYGMKLDSQTERTTLTVTVVSNTVDRDVLFDEMEFSEQHKAGK